MGNVNLYQTATSMWAIQLVDLGDISSWRSGIGHGIQACGSGAYALYSENATKPSGTAFNKIDFHTTGALSLYANKSLHSNILLSNYSTIGGKSGYRNFGFLSQPVQTGYPNCIIAADATFSSFCDVYLAIATINGVRRIGIISYSDVSFQRGWANFVTADAWSEVFLSEIKIPDPDNPYDGADPAGPGGGDPSKQNWDDNSDSIPDESLPDESTTGAVGTGFSTIFSPTKSQLQHLADVMWGNDIVSFLQNQVENIGSMFVSLGIVPFTVTKGSTRKVMWLGLVDTAIYLDTAANQFYELDMGTIDLATDSRIHRTDSVFDYSPFSKLGIYLPFIGFQELDIDECRENTIHLKYKIDILSGSCVAWIYVNGNPIYQFSGNCITQIPLSSQDAQTLFTNAVNVGVAAASVGMAGAVASAGDALTAERYMAGEMSAQAAEVQAGQHAAQVSAAEGNLASATANGMMGMKPTYKRSGAISASNSLISLRQPYLFLTTPREAVPERYQKYCGFPSNMTKKLGSLTGYCVVEDIRLNGLVATSPEVEEIYKLLKTGIII